MKSLRQIRRGAGAAFALLRGAVWAPLLAFCAVSCFSSIQCQQHHGQQQCGLTGTPAQGALTAAGAAALWAAEGCTRNGCRPPFYCNRETQTCELLRCGEGVAHCPVGSRCNRSTYRCEQ